jgi:hypothetical protein
VDSCSTSCFTHSVDIKNWHIKSRKVFNRGLLKWCCTEVECNSLVKTESLLNF